MEFQNICNEMVAPFLLRHPVFYWITPSVDATCHRPIGLLVLLSKALKHLNPLNVERAAFALSFDSEEDLSIAFDGL